MKESPGYRSKLTELPTCLSNNSKSGPSTEGNNQATKHTKFRRNTNPKTQTGHTPESLNTGVIKDIRTKKGTMGTWVKYTGGTHPK